MNPWANAWSNLYGTTGNPFGGQANPFGAFAPWTSGVRDFWAAEMQRQQSAMMTEAVFQAWQTWINAWTVLPFSLFGLGQARR